MEIKRMKIGFRISENEEVNDAGGGGRKRRRQVVGRERNGEIKDCRDRGIYE